MYIPINCLTHGSPLQSQTTPEALAKFCKEKGVSVALTDHNLFMCVQYYESMLAEGFKPMLGITLKIYGGEEESYAIILAKNEKGWKELLKLVYEANQDFKNEARLEVFKLIQLISNNLILIVSDFLDIFERLVPTAYYGLDLIQAERKVTSLKTVATPPNHYLTEKDWLLNKYLKCNYYKVSMKNATQQIFKDNRFFIPSEGQLLEWGYSQEEIDSSVEIYEQIENYNIIYKQELPHFECPNNINEDDYLRQLCREGFKSKGISGEVYIDRIKHELDVIKSAGMSGYFLIMQDIMKWCKDNEILCGVGRGSAAGCLISYLVGITNVDPIKYNLLFERFYSAERKGLPDVDLDFPPSKRENIIEYIQTKYGVDKFAQLSTFTTLKGPAAIKAVLRSRDVEAAEQNHITKKMPPEGKIAPFLQKQYNEVGSKSMVLWCINHIEEFKQWCSPTYEGMYAAEFQAAIELDQTITGRGRHASAYALANEPIYNKAPLIWDESADRFVVGVNMDDAEKLGLVKLDLLGIDLLDKADLIRKVVKNGNF